jgi:hypothetical protein
LGISAAASGSGNPSQDPKVDNSLLQASTSGASSDSGDSGELNVSSAPSSKEESSSEELSEGEPKKKVVPVYKFDPSRFNLF